MGKEDYIYFTVFLKASRILSWLVQWRGYGKTYTQIPFHSSSNAVSSLMGNENKSSLLYRVFKVFK